MRLGAMKENETPDLMKNSYQAIVAARDSLRNQKEARNMRTEMKKLDDEMNDVTRKNNEERLTIQELESELIKRRRRAEECRRLAEAQCSYRNTLEKMIRDAMHQSVVYKEQVRLNQAASSALMARLAVEEKPEVEEGKRGSRSFRAFPESEEDEESRNERGKGNVENWLQILLEKNNKNDTYALQTEGSSKKINEMIEKLDHKFPLLQKVDEEEVDLKKLQAEEEANNNNNTIKVEKTRNNQSARTSRMSFDLKNTPEESGRDKVVKRSESARAFRRIPSSPSLLFGMKKGIDCIRKKPVVSGNDDENEHMVKNNFIKSSLQTIKRAVKF